MNDGTYDEFLHDIQFLIANDAQLTTDLSQLCSILEADSSDADASEKASESNLAVGTKRKHSQGKQNQFQYRQKKQILELRGQVAALQNELALYAKPEEISSSSKWKEIAKTERSSKFNSILENKQLKAAIAQQSTFIETMQRYLHKKTRLELCDLNSEAWKAHTLVASQSLRIAAIHAIADRQYNRMQSTFLRLGLLDQQDDFFRVIPSPQQDGALVMKYVFHNTILAPFDAIGGAIWNVYNGIDPPTLATHATLTLEFIDENTVYEVFAHAVPNTAIVHANHVTKRYMEEDKVAIVWRSVLNDERLPQMATGTIQDEYGWCAISKLHDTSCEISFAHFVNSGYDIDIVTKALDVFNFGSPEHPIHIPDENAALPLNTLMDKGKRLEIALRKAIAKTLLSYKAAHAAY
ncbi:hypothetical protein THRCLA_03804 [Thraustotheca clavata]|uniref:M96 mating-specific protein family n=1 Tax=Thraustotheca clavata TaxID=74557 RepID=A0A1W0A0W2_9STRA|nr:hypothetical protein THRCLA_03804 [Thraustotheca clavata]